jgi:hypothetical protein
MLRALAVAGALAASMAGASPRTTDTDSPDFEAAYVAIQLDFDHAIGGSTEYAKAKRLVFARVLPGGEVDRIGLLDVPNRVPVLLKLEPGLYYLARLEFHANGWQENYHPRLFLFQAEEGRFNFAGIWHFRGAWGSAAEGGVWVKNWTSATIEDLDRVAAHYPKLAALRPPALSWIRAEDGKAPERVPQPSR